MNKLIERMLEIQDKDVRIFNLRKQIESVPEEKEKIFSMLDSAKASSLESKDAVLEIEKKIHEVEVEISTLKEKIRNLQQQSAVIKKNDEYRALLKEVDTFNKKIAGFEDKELECWEELEVAKAKRIKSEKALDATQSRIDSAIQDLETRDKNCNDQIEKVLRDRETLTKDIPEDLLNKYERLTSRRTNSRSFQRAVVPMTNDNCGGCFLQVVPQVRHLVQKEQVTACENCGALLYFSA